MHQMNIQYLSMEIKGQVGQELQTGGVEAKVQDRKKTYIAERKYEQVQCLKIVDRFLTIRL